MIKALVVCRAGVGSSMLLQNKVERVAAEQGYAIEASHGRIEDMVSFDGDVIVTMSDLAGQIEGKFPNVIGIFNITDDDEVREKIGAFVVAHEA